MRIQKKAFLKNFLVSIKNFHLLSVLKKIIEKMGVVFTKLPLKDNTRGFIDLDIGLAFYRNKDNVLALFIENKTGDFYKPRQAYGDLASVNMVIYDCIDFYHSKELNVFLRKIISERNIGNDND
ncbi:hypothetical protein SEEA0322_23024 [Salmonella enterica subsp. enterica serovar Agona str. 0322]|nr:hypothetical protein SEEA0322_23024 [Salmonella enterica subsp. enterica serovar Agona str. 0322]